MTDVNSGSYSSPPSSGSSNSNEQVIASLQVARFARFKLNLYKSFEYDEDFEYYPDYSRPKQQLAQREIFLKNLRNSAAMAAAASDQNGSYTGVSNGTGDNGNRMRERIYTPSMPLAQTSTGQNFSSNFIPDGNGNGVVNTGGRYYVSPTYRKTFT
ncbi:hypothetical protein PACTADRAFT_48132 [Pachysolen tannophilus NRRL Y-2460]|uniref:Uncharacterized protein n=1 Tax=Pachysolen tannophilus NRRL Y-2460 TaxID=669874 RepID=A0A1E4U2W6_PACTA|nr:hypothetical protein PACTADRAFT_48132 [Pachysolen tannophilus NRRL Y-2460]